MTITTSGGQESLIEIPSNTFNFAKSKLRFTTQPEAKSAEALNVHWQYLQTLPIRQLQIYRRTGTYLCDINNLENYVNMVVPCNTDLQDFLSNDVMKDNDGMGNSFRRSNGALSDNAFGTMAIRYDADASNASVSYTEPSYCQVGSAVNTADTPILNYEISGDMLKDTLCSLDKSIYFGEVLVMRIVWAPSTKMLWESKSVTNPASTPVIESKGISLSNLAFYLAVEQNKEVAQSLRAKVMSGEGMSMVIPYVHAFKQNLTSTSQNVSLRFNRGHGERLVRVYHSLYHNTESANTAFNNSNVADAKITEFYTVLDNERLQNFNIDTSAHDDWMIARPLVEGSVLQSNNQYKYKFVWIDDFTACTPIRECDLFGSRIGLDLNVEKKWDFNAITANAGHNHYSFGICQRRLSITKDGITCQ